MIKLEYKNKIIQILNDKVKFAFLFGSAVTQYFNKNSDIDIAVYLKNFPVSVEKNINLKYQLEKSINFEHDVDIVYLNNADFIITNQVITKGKLLVNNSPDFTENFIISGRSIYLDFKFFRKNLEDNLKTKIL